MPNRHERRGAARFAKGARRDPRDERDYLASARRPIKEQTIYRDLPLPIRNQGDEGTCVGHGTSRVKEWYDFSQRGVAIRYSPRYVYYYSKQIDGDPNEEGTFPRAALSVLHDRGVVYESDWPYQPHQRDVPNLAALAPKAQQQRIVSYARLRSARDIIANLILNGPVVISVPISEGWETDACVSTGIVDVSIPVKNTDGLHCIDCDGYNHETKQFRIANSWTADYGDHGFNWVDRGWLDAYLVDAWTMVDDIAIDRGIQVEVPAA